MSVYSVISLLFVALIYWFAKRFRQPGTGSVKSPPTPATVFIMLPSGKRYRGIPYHTTRLQSSFIPQAARVLNLSSTLQVDVAGLYLIPCKIDIIRDYCSQKTGSKCFQMQLREKPIFMHTSKAGYC